MDASSKHSELRLLVNQKVSLLWFVIGLLLVFGNRQTESKQHTNLVIIGGTGDLARKYLWASSLQLFSHHADENNTFSFYAGARIPQSDGDAMLAKIMEHVACDSGDEQCLKMRHIFIKNLKYVILKTSEHYSKLCQNISQSSDPDFKMRNIFYMSIPSSAYESVARLIYENCRQGNVTSTQVVLEKPFGEDKKTAIHHTETLAKYFEEHQIYRVDHYLAKSVSKQILRFRDANRDALEALMTNQYVDRVEIVMKERIGVKGRIDFYDQTGVIRDVMQNHLTELLALVTMELPTNISKSNLIEEYRSMLLKQIRPVNENSILIGQYNRYLKEAQEELNNISQSHLTPTFAAALLQIENSRWRGVPFLLVSGKQMEERSSYVRFLFREREFCVSGCADGNSSLTKYPKQLIFQIGHGSVPSPGILMSRSLFAPKWPLELKELSMTSKDSVIHGQSPGDFYYAVPQNDVQAYNTVLRDLYNYVEETFVTTARVLLLWDVWDRIIEETKSMVPRLYSERVADNLNFEVDKLQLRYRKYENLDRQVENESRKTVSVPKVYRNGSLVVKERNQLIKSLARHIMHAAKVAIKQRNVFHLALSGGSTPVALFQELAHNFPLFPWEDSHIWQVDERCVPPSGHNSNFRSIHEHLIKWVKIPYFNIHPMPVSFTGRICDPANNGGKLYEDQIKHQIPAQKFDLILLGLGMDGHTASLFPNSKSLDVKDRLVELTQSKGGNLDRMSLLVPVINSAREVTVLVTGGDKHDVINKLADMNSANKLFPITYISPSDGRLAWYIDNNAWSGS